MNEHNKEVYFDEYCKTCKYEKLPENADPCDECLSNPINFESHKPVEWEKRI